MTIKLQPWMDKIDINDLPNDDLKFVAEMAGLYEALILIFVLPGITVNIPKNGLKRLKERYIIKEYDGTKLTLNRLVVECDLSQRHVEKIIKKHYKKNRRDVNGESKML